MALRSTTMLLPYGARSNPRQRLFCLPYAGSGAVVYRPWADALPTDIEPVAIKLPGRETRLREPSLPTITQMVDVLLPEVKTATDLPYSIFGHSMGALLAFALTVALERENVRPPTHLFVSGRRSPDEPDPDSGLRLLPEEQFLDALQSRYGGIPEAARNEPDLMELLLPPLRADVNANETYDYQASIKVRCPVHVFGGAADRHPRPMLLRGWSRVAEQPVRVRLFAGDHFYLTTQREALTTDIASVMATLPVSAGG